MNEPSFFAAVYAAPVRDYLLNLAKTGLFIVLATFQKLKLTQTVAILSALL